MIRCAWTMPDNEMIQPGVQCVKYAEHGNVHVIAVVKGSSITFWKIKPRKRTIQAIAHVDLRDESAPDDDQCLSLYHSLIAARRTSK